MIAEKYPKEFLTRNPEITTPTIPSQLAVLKLEIWFSFLKNSLKLKLSRRDWSVSEYDIMLRSKRRLNTIIKKPRICFLFTRGRPSSPLLEDEESVFFDSASFLLLLSLVVFVFKELIHKLMQTKFHFFVRSSNRSLQLVSL